MTVPVALAWTRQLRSPVLLVHLPHAVVLSLLTSSPRIIHREHMALTGTRATRQSQNYKQVIECNKEKAATPSDKVALPVRLPIRGAGAGHREKFLPVVSC